MALNMLKQETVPVQVTGRRGRCWGLPTAKRKRAGWDEDYLKPILVRTR